MVCLDSKRNYQATFQTVGLRKPMAGTITTPPNWKSLDNTVNNNKDHFTELDFSVACLTT